MRVACDQAASFTLRGSFLGKHRYGDANEAFQTFAACAVVLDDLAPHAGVPKLLQVRQNVAGRFLLAGGGSGEEMADVVSHTDEIFAVHRMSVLRTNQSGWMRINHMLVFT